MTGDLSDFVAAYFEAMLWSTSDESTPEGGESMDCNYDVSDIAPDFYDESVADCQAFMKRAGNLLSADNFEGSRGCGSSVIEMAGHDFWLTRAGHGAGFWDGDWTSDKHQGHDGPLTKLCDEFGNVEPYVGDDGLIYGI